MNVAYYSDAFAGGSHGLARYAQELFGHLRADGSYTVRPVSAHVRQRGEVLASFQKETGHQSLPWPRKVCASLWSTVGFPRLEHWTPWADVVHCVDLDYPVVTRKPLVVTIHDIGPLTHPEFFSTSHPWLLRRALHWALRKASAIICVSRSTASAVEEFAKRPLGDRLAIIPEGVAGEFFEPVPASVFDATWQFTHSRTPYFLWAGSVSPRKNLPRVVEAFELVAKHIPHHLVLVGGVGWDSNETLLKARESSAAGRIHLADRVSDAELRGLYQAASGFVYVSLMEGFGLPIIEAMASGCPVITSNVTAMPEVAGDAALLVDPTDAKTIAAAMRELATNTALRDELVQRGRQRASQYRWTDCARAVALIYKRVHRSASGATSGGGRGEPALELKGPPQSAPDRGAPL